MNTLRYTKPKEIEEESMRIIEAGLKKRKKQFSKKELPVIMRAIHTTADFDYADNIVFTENAVERIEEIIKKGTTLVTDTEMALSGINKKALKRFGCGIFCFMSDPDVAKEAEKNGTTRAYAAMGYAACKYDSASYIIGNAPTALIRLCELLSEGSRPSFVIAVPVGFVNVAESKEMILEACSRYDVPLIVSLKNKGGSNVAAGIMNALLYQTEE